MRFLVLFTLLAVAPLHALHIARLDISELEWNGSVHTYKMKRTFEINFKDMSSPRVLDTIDGHPIRVQFFYKPVYSDFGDQPGFHCVIYDSLDRGEDMDIKFIYKTGLFDAGGKVRTQKGLKRWTGKLKYYPDTSIHIPNHRWRKDNYTVMVSSIQAWKSVRTAKDGKLLGKELSKIYVQGKTGEPNEGKYAGKIGKDELEMVLDPVRYEWDGEIWMEVVVRLYMKLPGGKKVELLAHSFDSRDKNVQFKNRHIRNAYEVRDSNNEFYMLIQGIKILPY